MERKQGTIRVRTDRRLKLEVEAIFRRLGLTPSEALTLFYQQVKHAGGIPFPVIIPNPRKTKVRRESETDRTVANPAFVSEIEAARAETGFLDYEEVFGPEKKSKKAPSKYRLLKNIRKFHDESLNGEYYAPFNTNSKNCRDVPKKTEAWFDKLSDFLREAAALADGGDHAPAVEAFRLLYDLIDRMERGEEIVFAEELGGWMIHADEKAALKSYMHALAATTGPVEFTDTVIPLLERDETDCLANKVYRSALKFATAGQKKALKAAVESRNIKVKDDRPRRI